MQDFFWVFAGRMVEGSESGAPHRNLRTLDAMRAFYRARRRAFARRLLASLSRRPTVDQDVIAGEWSEGLGIEGIELAVIDGRAVALPMIPSSCIGRWVSSYERFVRGEPGFSSFDIQVANGRAAVLGGMESLIRLEILRDAGERRVFARSRQAPGSARVAAAKPGTIQPLAPSRRPDQVARRAAS